MSAAATYLIGWIVIVVGLAVGAYLLNIPALWVCLAAFFLIAVGVMALSWRAKPPRPPSA
jgi:hypothetical protein